MNTTVKPIVLEGEDSIRFAEAMFHPSKEDMEHFRKHLDEINNEITLHKTENGFEADVKNLDLSFIKESEK